MDSSFNKCDHITKDRQHAITVFLKRDADELNAVRMGWYKDFSRDVDDSLVLYNKVNQDGHQSVKNKEGTIHVG